MASFAHRFKQSTYSDCELSFRLQRQPHVADDRARKRARTETQDQPGPEVIAAFPAHRVILCSSSYFEAQVQNWQTTTSSAAAAASGSQQQAYTDKPVLTLTLAAADELPAAEAVIAGLYGVEDAFGKLEHHQLVQALIIADMIDANKVAKQASQQIKVEIESRGGLSEAALNVMARLPAWPACLLQLLPSIVGNTICDSESTELDAVLAAGKNKVLQRMLISVLGDLQAVWRDKTLQDLLMQLPCAAMLLLLSSDELRVPSEDLVMFTAQEFFEKYYVEDDGVTALADCIRAPHLSDVMLHYVCLSEDSSGSVVKCYARQLKQLLLLRRSQGSPDDTSSMRTAFVTWKVPRAGCLGRGSWWTQLQQLLNGGCRWKS